MPPPPSRPPLLLRTGLLLTGICILVLALAMEGELGPVAWVLLGLGGVTAVLGVALPALPPVWNRVGVALLTLLLTIAAIEAGGRLLGVDYSGEVRRFRETPIYYQQPVVPVGEAFFRRPGPDRWEGRVIHTFLQQIGVLEADRYADETPVRVDYDADGFRNPADLVDWEIVLVGDSFVELGYLADEQLVSSRLGRMLGVRVKNLGVSFTGTSSQVFYLREYGAAPSARHAVLGFFEGNDLDDLLAEHARLQRPGERELRSVEARAQPSFLAAVAGIVHRQRRDAQQPQSVVNAVYETAGVREPVTVYYTPSGRDGLEPETRSILDGALAAWAATARELGMEPWLLYLPCKHRVLHDHINYLDNGWRKDVVAGWIPTDLPEVIAQLSTEHGIRFVDPTPALTEEARAGRPAYNLIWDTHVDGHGAEVIARVLAEAFRAHRPDSGR